MTPRPDRVHVPSASWMKIELWPVPNVDSKKSVGLITPVADTERLYTGRMSETLVSGRFAPSTDERPAIAQPVLASVLAVLSVFTVVTGLYNRPLEDWSNQGPASLGIPADGQGR